MCKSSTEPGGPYRCSYHARTARDAALAKNEAAADAAARADAAAAEAQAAQAKVLEDAGVEPIEHLLGMSTVPLTDEQNARIAAADAAVSETQRAATAAHEALDKSADELARREDEYRATPDGAAEAAREVELLANSPLVQDRQTQKMIVSRELKKLSDAEQAMANDAFARSQRWGKSSQPAVRAAFPGGSQVLIPDSPTGRSSFIVTSSGMHGTYTNSFQPDPNYQDAPGSVGDPQAWVQRSQMQLIRADEDGTRRRLNVPVHTETSSDQATSGPTVRAGLVTAVERAEDYDPDYKTWAAKHGYQQEPGEWRGGTSYELGRAAHKEAGHAHENVRKFLDPDEYDMIATEIRENRE